MDWVIEGLKILNEFSSLGIIGLLTVAIIMLVKGKTSMFKEVDTIKNNHLHELPEMAESLNNIKDTLQRIEVKMGEDFAHIKARINGGSHK